MKKILLFLGVATLFASCDATPHVVEGRVVFKHDTHASKEKSTTPTLTLYRDGEEYELLVSKETQDEIFKQKRKDAMFVRMTEVNEGMYELTEIAKLLYHDGRPSVFEFPSDKKVIAEVVREKVSKK